MVVVFLLNVFVLVGVGSGKICVLVYCIVWLMEVENIMFFFILVVIFINKVVREMCGCIELLMGRSLYNMWIGIFYGFVYWLFCVYYVEVGLLENF